MGVWGRGECENLGRWFRSLRSWKKRSHAANDYLAFGRAIGYVHLYTIAEVDPLPPFFENLVHGIGHQALVGSAWLQIAICPLTTNDQRLTTLQPRINGRKLPQ